MSDDLDHLQDLIRIKTRRKQQLEKQQAVGGLMTDPRILLEIEDISMEIEKLQAQLSALKDINSSPIPQLTAPTAEKEDLTSRNPFHYGGPVLPQRFIGHQSALNFCRDRLTVPRPEDIAISGERRIGKTSLLHYLNHICGQVAWGKHLCLFVDFAIFGGSLTAADFWYMVCQRLQEELEARTPGLNFSSIIQTQTAHSGLTFLALLRAYTRYHPAPSVILLLDEFELLLHAYNKDICNLLKSLRAATLDPVHSITLITATRDPLAELCREFIRDTGLEFHASFHTYSLKPFRRDEMERVVQALLGFSRAKVELTGVDLDYIWRLSQWKDSGAHPFFVQMVASLIFDHRRIKSDPLTYADLERQFEGMAAPYREELPAEKPNYEQALERLETSLPLDNPELTNHFYLLRRQFRKVINLEPRHRTFADQEALLEALDELARIRTGLTFDQLARS